MENLAKTGAGSTTCQHRPPRSLSTSQTSINLGPSTTQHSVQLFIQLFIRDLYSQKVSLLSSRPCAWCCWSFLGPGKHIRSRGCISLLHCQFLMSSGQVGSELQPQALGCLDLIRPQMQQLPMYYDPLSTDAPTDATLSLFSSSYTPGYRGNPSSSWYQCQCIH